MKVGLGQIDCVVGDVAANTAAVVGMVRDAAAAGCGVVWLPELADTGYGLSVMREVAGAWPGPGFDAVRDAACECGIAVGVGLSERAPAPGGTPAPGSETGSARGSGAENSGGGGVIFNSLAVFDAGGELVGHYRKAHLFVAGTAGTADESACFNPAPGSPPGSSPGNVTERGASASGGVGEGGVERIVELHGLRHGLSVCYDLRFPELYRRLAAGGADVLVNVTAWPNARPTHWDILSRARAVENQAYFVGAARVGCDGGIQMNGRSRIVDPRGEVVAEGSADRVELVVGEIDAAHVAAFREEVPALAARRADLRG